MLSHLSPMAVGHPTAAQGWLQRWQGTSSRWTLCAIVLVAFTLNLQLLDRYPLREDEAIYSVWALHTWQHDPWLRTVWPDKPPLFYWTLAPLLQLFGATGAGARWLNIAVSTLTPLVVGATARRLWQGEAALVATLFMALSSFGLSFAPTVYTDPLLVLCGHLAFYCALCGRNLGAGFWLGAAIMTKQQGVLYLPLVVGMVVIVEGQRLHSKRRLRSTLFPFVLGMVIVMAPILYWDSLRWQVAPSPWDLSIRNYGSVTLLPPTSWPARLAAWYPLLWQLTASNWLWWLGGLAGLGAAWQMRDIAIQKSLVQQDLSGAPAKFFGLSRFITGAPDRSFLGDYTAQQRNTYAPAVLLLLWGTGFLLLHLVSSVQSWDRYLLPLAPLVALYAAWSWHYRLWPHQHRLWQIIAVVTLLLLLQPALKAANGTLPLGGDHGDYAGLVEATDWLRHNVSTNVVLYHRQLGWQAQFYFYSELAADDYELRWFPDPIYLAANAAQLPYKRRFLLQPRWSSMRDLALHVTTRNLQLIERNRWSAMTLYEISEHPQQYCVWCLCQPPMRRPWLVAPATTLRSTRETSRDKANKP